MTDNRKKPRPLEEILGLVPVRHDVFCSYAHADNYSGQVEKMLLILKQGYQSLTGQNLNVFIDKTDLITADLWERKIITELSHSRIFLSVLSPSYFKSEWCKREWIYAEEREYNIELIRGSALPSGIIVPLLFVPLDRGRFTIDEKLFLEKAKKRQWYDLSQVSHHSPCWRREVEALVEDVIEQIDVQTSLVPSEHARDVGTVIVDSKTGLMWAGTALMVQLDYGEAKVYVKNLDLAGFHDWQIPTKAQLEGLLDPDITPDNPDGSPVPLRSPFNTPRFGYLHSCTRVPGKPGHWIMNIRNGHIFNGFGRKAFVRAVRTPK